MKTKPSLFVIAGGLAALSVLAGCNPKDKESLATDGKKFASSAGEALKNASLAGKVNGVLAVWKGIDMNGWSVEAQDKTITLTGEVRNKDEKRRILFVVNQIREVDKVVDKLTVTGQGEPDKKTETGKK